MAGNAIVLTSSHIDVTIAKGGGKIVERYGKRRQGTTDELSVLIKRQKGCKTLTMTTVSRAS